VANLTTALLDFIVLFAHSGLVSRTMNAISPRKMGTRSRSFNFFFRLALALAFALSGYAAGSSKTNAPATKSKPVKATDIVAAVRFYMEATDDGSAPKAEVIRSLPQSFAIQKEPFFDERDVVLAEILETPDGGFMMKIDATPHGKNAIEMATVASNGRHLVIFSQWSQDQDNTDARWLAAPLLRGPLRNGSVVFTPDCDRVEAQKIVDGLNNVAIKLKNQPKVKGGAGSGSAKKAPSGNTPPAQELIDKHSSP
jgi:hypothetical protein